MGYMSSIKIIHQPSATALPRQIQLHLKFLQGMEMQTASGILLRKRAYETTWITPIK
jgi:hypothetical protein